MICVQSASGRSRSLVLQCGTIFRLTSHPRRHSRFSDSTSSRSCSLSLIRTFIPDSHSLLLPLHLCAPSNNWHYLGHTEKMMMMMCLTVWRLEVSQRSLTALRQENQSLVEMSEMLKRHHETLRQQHDEYVYFPCYISCFVKAQDCQPSWFSRTPPGVKACITVYDSAAKTPDFPFASKSFTK